MSIHNRLYKEGDENKEIIDNVLRGTYSYTNPVWDNISD